MEVVVAVHAAAALLLVIAGLAKVARPAPAAELLVSLHLPAAPFVVRLIGVAESVVGLAALAFGGPVPAAATAVLYVGFVVVVVRAIGVGATSCGCFGRVDAPPSWIHVGGNLAFAAASFLAIAGDAPIEVMEDQPAGGAGFVLLVGVLAGLALVGFTALPEALAARRGGSAPPQFHIHEDGL